MGRPPSNGGPSFRFNPSEVAEMEGILQAHNCLVPQREILVALAEKFSNSAERSGKPAVQMKQVWNWFQNRRYALRAKTAKPPAKLNVSPMPQHDLATARSVSQAPQHPSVPAANVRNVPQVPQPVPTPSVPTVAKNGSENSQMEFEARSARDGAWYDVASFLSHRSLETGDPEVLVRFSGFGAEEDEWVNVRKHVRQRSLPCESSECVAVLPGDLILCFQEGKEQALYFDAHVLDAQRRRHDVRGCRCRFLVRYDHDQSEEIVPLRKVCRRPETDYRMQQLHAESANMKPSKAGSEPHTGSNVDTYPLAEGTLQQPKVDGPAETISKLANPEVHGNCGPLPAPVSHANIPIMTSAASTAQFSALASAAAPSPNLVVSVAPAQFSDANASFSGAGVPSPVASNVAVAPTSAPTANSSIQGAPMVVSFASIVPVSPAVAPASSIPGDTIVASVASDTHVGAAAALVADYSIPAVSTMASAADSSVSMAPTMALGANSVVPAVAPVANSSVPVVPTMAPAANTSISVAPTEAANSSIPVASTAEARAANSSIPVASTAEASAADSSVPVAGTVEAADVNNSSVPTASTADAPIANNSSVPMDSIAEAAFANNSRVAVGMITEAPIDSRVLGAANGAPEAFNTTSGTEFEVLDRVSESGPVDNVDNPNAQSSLTTTGKVTEEGPVESMQLG